MPLARTPQSKLAQSCGGPPGATPMTVRHGPDRLSVWTNSVRLRSVKRQIHRSCTRHSTGLLVLAGGIPRDSLGTFPVRFPSDEASGDDGWHVDVSFGYEHPDFMEWRANVSSKGWALLMLFLFSDVGTEDAPTRIRVGSHIDVARQLAPAGEAGLTLRELAADAFAGSASRPKELAVGKAGTVYLCHPFLVHAAQPHRGTSPRFMAQPPLMPREPISLFRQDGNYSPVEWAILNAISRPAA